MTVREVADMFSAVEPQLNLHVFDKDENALFHGKCKTVFPKIGEYEATRVVLVVEAVPTEVQKEE